ncbi:tetratricopeptide repeat protein [Mangrovivirga cuniculi]|uniref:Uncharacterized protein n=1 Tax=Mangrovivirga cuniculi TaxID=2715131 RepID=A0A4D7JM71_9BACT|nr:tetratricopeptide repeat protein [Mangrovivirga cuniculi]QCK16939.1 hypothetical protein DCC35_20490 [Mangrovivirga cuniculi]
MKKRIFTYCFILIISVNYSFGQTIFSELKSDEKRADKEFNQGNYKEALLLYLDVNKSDPGNKNIIKKLAITYKGLDAPLKAADYLLKYADTNLNLSSAEMLMLGNYLTDAGKYNQAINWFKKYQNTNPSNELVAKQIWQLENRDFLYEDSVLYEIKKLPINTDQREFGVSISEKGIVYLSDQPTYGGLKVVDGQTNRNFLRWFISEQKYDSLLDLAYYEKPKEFLKGIKSKYHKGNIYISENSDTIFYSKNSPVSTIAKKSRLEIVMITRKKDKWSEPISLPINNPGYSTNHPYFNSTEQKLYFSSDMSGGYGGFDLYYSSFNNGKWGKPVNLGSLVNTKGNESYPYKNGNSFYFTSDGHTGLGGMDIYSVIAIENEFSNLKNLGYPVNTNFDDFGLVLFNEGQKGYFSSNRNKNALDDDIYHLKISLQSFPLLISGTLRLKDLNNVDENTSLLKNATLLLIDKNRKKVVSNSKSDNDGQFEINIPYDGDFYIKVSDKYLGEALINLDIPRNREEQSTYKIVIVKELFSVNNKIN